MPASHARARIGPQDNRRISACVSGYATEWTVAGCCWQAMRYLRDGQGQGYRPAHAICPNRACDRVLSWRRRLLAAVRQAASRQRTWSPPSV